MISHLELLEAAYYSENRINGTKIPQESYVTTDSMLQNKFGITNTLILPKGNLIAFSEGDILVGNIRPYLKKIWYAKNSGGCSPDVLVLKPKPNIDSKFLYYSLFRDDFFIHMMKGSKGTKMPRGDKNQILKFHIPDFKFTSQQKIASVLSALDSKIELNNRINAELEAMAKMLYDYWFVQFEFPFDFAQGKPDKNGKPYKTSGGKMVWNEELKREIPEGWEVKKLRQVLVIKNGRDHKHLESGKIPVYGSGGIMRYANNYIYDLESILIPRKGTLGNLFYIEKPFWCVDTIFYTQMKFQYSCKYLFYAIQVFNLSSMNTGTAVPSMTTEILNNLTIVFPNLETLKAFDVIVSPIFDLKECLEIENQKLTELRDWLLPMLMNGQVKVGDVKEYEISNDVNLSLAAEK